MLKSVWEHLDFWATCLIFVTSAMYVPRALASFTWVDAGTVVVVFLAAQASRGLILWGLLPSFSAIGASEPLSNGYKLVLWWGGMWGAVTIALALATAATDGIPAPVAHMVVSTAIGFVMATLVVNGLSLRPLMNVLHLDKLGEHDRAIRNRIRQLARRRVMKELEFVSRVLGRSGEDIIRSVLPLRGETLRYSELNPERQLYMALDIWCQHEYEAILAARERGVLSRRHADTLRHRTDRIHAALRLTGAEGYRVEALARRKPSALLRLAFFLHHRTGWERPLSEAIGDRLGQLLGEAMLLRDLIRQAQATASRLFRPETASKLVAELQERLDLVEDEVASLDRVFPEFTAGMRRHHAALIALGLVESEFRRHLADATISSDVFDDLQDERREIARSHARRPDLRLRSNIRRRMNELLGKTQTAGLGARGLRQAAAGAYIAYPGEVLNTGRFPGHILCVIAGKVETVAAPASPDAVAAPPGPLAEWSFFGKAEVPVGAHAVHAVRSLGYGSFALIRRSFFDRAADQNLA